VEDIADEYEDLREEHYEGLKDRRYLDYTEAIKKRFLIDWSKSKPVQAPSFLGTKTFNDYPLTELIPYIDWNPFFQTWQLRGKYPNRGFPKLFNDADVGVEAKKLYDEAQKMLNVIIRDKILTATGIVGFYPANANEDDVEIYSTESRTDIVAKFYGLRQQAEKVYFKQLII
jgi:5-methyltetrahydrofolate--homocysteine methyltransferase